MQTLTDKKLAIQNIIDLAFVIMCGPKKFDMSSLMRCIEIEMQETGLCFRKYFDVLDDASEKYLVTQFDQTDDYFYDAINTMNISEGKIGLLVKLCIA